MIDRILPVGEDAVLVQLDDPGAVQNLASSLLAAPLDGIIDIIPAARTILLAFDPMMTDGGRIAAGLGRMDIHPETMPEGRTVDIHMAYDGPDLPSIAEYLGWTEGELIRRHQAMDYRVAFIGFTPGFAYMRGDDPAFILPRLPTPRRRVRAGSVALADDFCGIYPTESPGGWRILGHTPQRMWQPERNPPALLSPGDRVRFRDLGKGPTIVVSDLPPRKPALQGSGMKVLRADRPALFQDLGRQGHADQGVSASGALDLQALVAANLLLGNPAATAALEIAYGGFALMTHCPLTIAVTGAPCPLEIRAQNGHILPAPFARPFALDPDESLIVGMALSGTRSYLAIRGGFDVTRSLGSASRDTLAALGPDPVIAGDILRPAENPASAVAVLPLVPCPLPRIGDIVTLDIHPGPRADWLSDEGIAALLGQCFDVTPDSNRIGMRLFGQEPVRWREQRELPPEGVRPGAIQIPPDGQPVLFLSDHPLTGGYPVVAIVARHHLALAAQTPGGAHIRFKALSGRPFIPGEPR